MSTKPSDLIALLLLFSAAVVAEEPTQSQVQQQWQTMSQQERALYNDLNRAPAQAASGQGQRRGAGKGSGEHRGQGMQRGSGHGGGNGRYAAAE